MLKPGRRVCRRLLHGMKACGPPFPRWMGEGIQVIHPQLDWKLNVVDLQYLPEVQRKKEVQRLVEEDAESAL